MATTNKLSVQAARTGVQPTPTTTKLSVEAARTGVQTPMAYNPPAETGSIPPAYGSNIANFDPTNKTHIALADAGQAYATAKAAGDKAGMSAAEAKGAEIRAGGGLDFSFDPKKGNTTFGTPISTTAMVTPPTFTAPTEQQYIPQFTPSMPVMDEAAIRKYAQDQIAAKLATLRQSADQSINQGRTTADRQLQGLQTGYDRQRETIGEDRSLQDVQAARNLSPFSGRSDYALGMIEMGRARTDREMQQDHLSRQANIQQDLANLENEINQKYALMEQLGPDEQERLFQEIKRDERNYELMLRGELRSDLLANGQLNDSAFNRALQTYGAQRSAFESDRGFGYDMYRDNVNWTGYVPQGGYGGGQGFAAQGGAGAQTYGGLNTQSFTPQAGAMRTLQGQQFDRGIVEADREYDYRKARDEILDERDKRDFDENVRRYGLDYAIQKRQIAVSEKNARTSAASSGNAQANAEHNRLMDIWKATGKAPAGIAGVTPGTAWYEGAAKTPEPKPNDIYSEAVTALDGMTPAQRKSFFNGEKAKIIKELGPSGYNTLYNMYFDEYGDPK